MKYCVIKNTTKVIDGSNNFLEIMLQNAINAGYLETEIEILTEEEYQSRKANEPIPPHPLSAEERISMAEQAINDLIMTIMMGGI